MAAALVAVQRRYLPETEIMCGSITVKTGGQVLTLHCGFCELSFGELNCLQTHLLREHPWNVIQQKAKSPEIKEVVNSEFNCIELSDELLKEDVEVIEEVDEVTALELNEGGYQEQLEQGQEQLIEEIVEIEVLQEIPADEVDYMELVNNDEIEYVNEEVDEPSDEKHSSRTGFFKLDTFFLENDLKDAHSRAETFRLIKLFKEARCLWDTENVNFYNDRDRKTTFKAIEDQLLEEYPASTNCNENFVRFKIGELKNLFRSYEIASEGNGVKVNAPNGPIGPIYKELYQELQFLRGHLVLKPWKCCICGEFVQEENERAHEKNHKHDETSGKCRMCKVLLPSKRYVTPHLAVKHNIFICMHCNRDDFRSKLAFQVHFAKVHPDEEPPRYGLKYRKIYTCECCEGEEKERFYSKQELHEHMSKFLSQFRNTCKMCGKGYRLKGELIAHLKSNHIKELGLIPARPPKPPSPFPASFIEPADESGEFECEFCYVPSFSTELDLQEHLKAEHWSIILAFRTPRNLNNDPNQEHGEDHAAARVLDTYRSLICEFCGKQFEAPCKLRIHRKYKHLHVGQHKCRLCEKAFNTAERLELHTNSVHIKRPQHFCDLCLRGFYAKRYLEAHKMNVHKMKQPYECTECGKSFMLPYTLRLHTQKGCQVKKRRTQKVIRTRREREMKEKMKAFYNKRNES